MSISVNHISKHFGAFTALDNISLEIPEGELVALLGPSGCGKTTLLRIIAGLEQADQGDIFLKGDKVTDKPVKNRQIGFVFQHYALFRHMTVFDNVAFGLKVKPRRDRLSDADIAKKVHALLELVQLDWLHDRYPDQLSGGQRQRIALARALAVEPSVLLLDEPFGALDASVRKDLRQWLRNLHHDLNVTSIFVTHDQEEAMEVASQVVVLNHGRIEQQGAPGDIYDHPANAFVSRFIGQTNVFDLDEHDADWLQTAGLLTAQQKGKIAHVRPHDIVIEKSTADSDAFVTLKDWQHLGSLIRIELVKSGAAGQAASVYAEMPNDQFRRLHLNRGDKVELRIRHAHWFH
ncbi:MAG: sulfate ABC transporter ATP-binding protein [Methylobacter sp.]|nr:sulfate ABC transporter ATP-binding protein [Methylobacter sp.]